MKFYKFLFFNSMIFGTLISISSFSWMSMWMGLEINLLSIIPLMKSKKNALTSEAMLKYFLTQTLASLILLFSILMILMFFEFLPQNSNNWMIMMFDSALMMKMGSAPFHFWFPEIIEGLTWMNSFIMLTWQKIAPMIVMMINPFSSFLILNIIVISMIISGIQGLNQTSLRKILVFSSINHMAWMLSTFWMTQATWFLYFLIYSLISLNIIFMLYLSKTSFLTQLFNFSNFNPYFYMFFSFNFFSLGGIPPFLGFYPKWLIISFFIKNNAFLISFMIFCTLITLFFYLRITLPIYSLSYFISKFWVLNSNFFKMLFLNSINLILLPFFILISWL